MIEIISTKDGSHTLRNTELNETYHSVHGAMEESNYVFIKHGLDFKVKESAARLSILEVGFGTGLNTLLTAKRCNEHPVEMVYTAIEAFPLSRDIWSRLNYADAPDDRDLFERIHHAGWNTTVTLSDHFSLIKLNTTIQDTILLHSAFDIVYFDAFAPEKQPDMWTLPILSKVVDSMSPGSVFVTYCAKGQLRRDLKSLGLSVESLPGPPGKREMTRANKPAPIGYPPDSQCLTEHVCSKRLL